MRAPEKVKDVFATVKNAFMSETGKKVFIALLLLGVFVVLTDPHTAAASTGKGTEFQGLYDKLLAYVQGLPGIMFAIGLLVFGIYMSFFGARNIFYFFGSALGAAAIFLIPTIAQSMGGALW